MEPDHVILSAQAEEDRRNALYLRDTVRVYANVSLAALAVVLYYNKKIKEPYDVLASAIYQAALAYVPNEDAWPDVDTALLYLDSLGVGYLEAVQSFMSSIYQAREPEVVEAMKRKMQYKMELLKTTWGQTKNDNNS